MNETPERLSAFVAPDVAPDLIDLQAQIDELVTSINARLKVLETTQEITEEPDPAINPERVIGDYRDCAEAAQSRAEVQAMSRTLSLQDYLVEEFKLLGVQPHITHLKQPEGCFYNFVTVATPQYKLYPYLAAVLSEIYSEGSRTHKTGSDLDRLVVRRFAELGYGVSPCHAKDNFSRKRGRIISEGRMLKALRNGGIRR